MGYLKHVPRFLLVLILIGVIMAGIGQAYQEHAELIDLSRFSPRGKLLSIRDQLTGKEYRLHLYCTGDHKPHMPTVILINGAGDNSLIWSLVQPYISETYRVCSYDRAGYGWSDPGPGPRSAYQNANELHALLSEAGIEPGSPRFGNTLLTSILHIIPHKNSVEESLILLRVSVPNRITKSGNISRNHCTASTTALHLPQWSESAQQAG